MVGREQAAAAVVGVGSDLRRQHDWMQMAMAGEIGFVGGCAVVMMRDAAAAAASRSCSCFRASSPSHHPCRGLT